jgi:riboflavin kinase/FMN adenylyltransferase
MKQVRLETLAPLGVAAPAVAIGNFDGVHRGHQELVRETVSRALAEGGTAVALTFDPHPARVLAPERVPPALTTPAQKAELLEALGVEVLAILPFTAGVAALAPEEFARQVLAGVLRARHVVVGESFRFGHRQAGDAAFLTRLGESLGFTVGAIAPVLDDGRPVSSSRVRETLAAGDVSHAAVLLGRSHFVDATVVEGDRRGRTIGVPTANLEPDGALLPARGVYAGTCRLPGGAGTRLAVVNVGRRPTFGGRTVTVEAHLPDFAGDLYGRRVRVSFVARLRDEQRFDGAGALVAQIRRDVERARALVSPASEGV